MPEFVFVRPSIVYELATGGYRWDTDAARYRSKDTGRFVSEIALRLDLDRFNSQVVGGNLQDITDRMIDGRITLSSWQQQIAAELKDAWGVNIRIGRGGASQMTQADYGRYGGRLAYEYNRLTRFAIEIETGNLTPGQIKARMQLYANAVRVGYWDGKTAAGFAAGFTEERRVLTPAENCPDCIGYAAQGWQPLGSLPEPGTNSVCGRNCRCEKEYR